MAVIQITKKNFEEVKNSGKTVLLDFFATWCGPCRMLSPFVEEISEEHPEYIVGKINVDDDPELAVQFNAMSIPLLVVLKDGKVVNQAVGYRPKEDILKLFK